MLRRDLYRVGSLLSFLLLTACGGGAGGSGGEKPDDIPGKGDGDGTGGDGDGTDGDGDGTDGDGDGDGTDGDGDGDSRCKTSCDTDDCGEAVSDRCGGFLKCPSTCAEGQICGVTRPDKCDFPPPAKCDPLDASEVCQGKCGSVSDGCSALVDCNSLNGGLDCDPGTQFCKAEACVDNDAACKPVLVATACAGKCGHVSDGCGNLYTCTNVNGGISCGAGEECRDATNSCEPIVAACTPLLPAVACAGTCGVVGDGCEGQIDCNTVAPCPTGQTCGGGGTPGACGAGQVVDPDNCPGKIPQATACANKCGWVPNGCGGGYTCGSGNGGLTCNSNAGESCVAGSCVAPVCTPKTKAEACPGGAGNNSCGVVQDGCNGTITCDTCPSGQSCGLGGANLCGNIPVCQPTPIATACAGKCGTVANGCGGSYTCNSGNGGVTCTGSEYCGAKTPNTCGAPPVTCTPKTCAQLGHSCGMASNGCGGIIDCWTTPDKSCGASASCLTNAQGGQSCTSGGPGCVGTLCGNLPTTCAANAQTKLTGTVKTPGRQSGASWINQLPVPNALVYIPGNASGTLPAIFQGVNASNAKSCGRCDDEELVPAGESVLAAAVTDYRGQFTLEGRIPVGVPFRIVVKIGKWRRVIQVPGNIASACNSRALDHAYTRLSASNADGLSGTQIPKIAISTGEVDQMECVFRNMGLAESEFTVPSQSGRIHMYQANGARMGTSAQTCTGNYDCGFLCWRSCSADNNAGCNTNKSGCSWSTTKSDISVADSNLTDNATTLNSYDMVVFDCEGGSRTETANNLTRILDYVNAGGRMFASHYSYSWIETNGALANSAAWNTGGDDDDAVGLLSMTSGPTTRARANPVKSVLFRDWLRWQGALTGTTAGATTNPATPQLDIKDPRDRAGATVGASTDEWIYRNTARVCSNNANKTCTKNSDCTGSGTCNAAPSAEPRVQQLSFNTPYSAAETAICGRVAYSGFHVANASNNGTKYFPDVCSNGELTAQEKVLAFMLFDLATCVSAGDPPQPPSCTPKTAAQICPGVNDACGYVSDGCGGVVDCAGCSTGFYCDGNTCLPQECTPSTCASLGFNCGNHADGCGGVARNSQGTPGCGDCTGSQICGLGGAGLCGSATCPPIPVGTACPPNSCGTVSNGCGGTYECGTCTAGQVCGGGGPNLCGAGICTPISKTTACASKNCGSVADGCGGSYDCGSCAPPDSCGGGGQANVCGHPVCTKLTQAVACAGKECGYVSDGCGGSIQCGTCPSGGICGGAGPNKCGAICTPTTCAIAGAQCGAIADGCGNVLNCGTCPTGQVCGGGSTPAPNQCGTGATCTPRTCAQASAECGLVGDGCGAVLDCGICTKAGETCGGAGQANQCGIGTGGCNKLTCEMQNVQCGASSDGCGGLLECGGCNPGFKCELSKCEPLIQ